MKVIIIKSDTPSVFCTGGDLRQGFKFTLQQKIMFVDELYRLMYVISTIRVPYVALMNGVTMGGGAGLAVHGKFRVATENTVFSMPEVKGGSIPDAGFSYVFPRLPGNVGLYLGLTGARLIGMVFLILFLLNNVEL